MRAITDQLPGLGWLALKVMTYHIEKAKEESIENSVTETNRRDSTAYSQNGLLHT